MRNRLCFRLACFTVLLECAWVEELLVVVVYPPELVVHHPLNFTLILAMYRLPHATQQVLLLVKHNPLSSHVFSSHNTAGEFFEMFDVHGSFFRRACCPSGSQRYRRFLDFRIISVLLGLPCSLLTCALMPSRPQVSFSFVRDRRSGQVRSFVFAQCNIHASTLTSHRIFSSFLRRYLKAKNRATHTGHRRECGHQLVPQQNHDWATGACKGKTLLRT